jgi:ribosomal protein L13E
MLEVQSGVPVPEVKRERSTTREVRETLQAMNAGECFDIAKPVTAGLCKRVAKALGIAVVVAEGKCWKKGDKNE